MKLDTQQWLKQMENICCWKLQHHGMACLSTNPHHQLLCSCIYISSFPDAWKVARITPIPKSNNSNSNSNMRPISILPVLSKVFEGLRHYQLVEHIDSQKLLKEKISGFRKGHSTTTVLLDIRTTYFVQ